ncbi:MAG: DUF4159 domain-containing protein [Nitrospinaceae bacterium]|nr:DUF4159 domain-containing protein [Nitrospinaceae bacterium]NIR55212.1 DUF4159 domain-containing protein [Nitrospinaceae bacterium]NIS85639.1 DUF4159 domain-containing protein [Nitrospinaceae bacterium]NIT82484.1 DUF4159 domain-containing protein [Nitrospinaceae bacterium]NIU44689.1 DUF4159 domain-containing protein [Nitrospinaceae bacterium]
MRLTFMIIIACLQAGILSPLPGFALGDSSKMVIPQIRYKGGMYKPRSPGVESLLAQIAKRTSVEVRRVPLDLQLKDKRLYRYPIIYMGGNRGFDPLSEKELNTLRHYLTYGGFLLIDDNSSKPNSPFDDSVRRMVRRLFPHTPLQRLPRNHSVFRSFYLVNQVVGRVVNKPYLEGITSKGRTVLVYSGNDLAGAWSKNKLGHWEYDMIGGGFRQREMSIRLGINIVLYALTLDYKKDMVHLPIILERLRRANSQ